MNLYKKAIHVLGKEKAWGLLGILILTILGAGAELCGVSMILPFVNAIMDPEFISGSSLLSSFQNATGMSTNGMISLLAMSLVVVYLVKNIYASSLEDAKKKFDQTKCTDAIEFSGIEWRHSRFHYGINHS